MEDNYKNVGGDKPSTSGRKLWKPLKLDVLDVPSATQGGSPMGRIQSPESFNFYKPS
jgi:hypothetical protein